MIFIKQVLLTRYASHSKRWCWGGGNGYLLCPQAFEFLLQPCAKTQLQRFPLLAGGLQLRQRVLQSLHLLHVGALSAQLLLQLAAAGLCRTQRLLQGLAAPPPLLAIATQVQHLPLQAVTLVLQLLIWKRGEGWRKEKKSLVFKSTTTPEDEIIRLLKLLISELDAKWQCVSGDTHHQHWCTSKACGTALD